MPAKKSANSVTFKDKTTYAVHLNNGTIVNVEATSAEEAATKAKAKEKQS